ncbi:MAG: hypothetical protein IT391_02225, partial [Nitrospira sp.]|nr:hypothetical protein [Nitrospira sp.]
MAWYQEPSAEEKLTVLIRYLVHSFPLARIIHEYRREAFEAEARRGFSHVRPTEAYVQSVEEAEREKPRRTRESDDG